MESEISSIRKVESTHDFKTSTACEVLSRLLVEYYTLDTRFVESDGREGFLAKTLCNVDNKNLLISQEHDRPQGSLSSSFLRTARVKA